jgi:hypothetical protein
MPGSGCGRRHGPARAANVREAERDSEPQQHEATELREQPNVLTRRDRLVIERRPDGIDDEVAEAARQEDADERKLADAQAPPAT